MLSELVEREIQCVDLHVVRNHADALGDADAAQVLPLEFPDDAEEDLSEFRVPVRRLVFFSSITSLLYPRQALRRNTSGRPA